MNDKPNYLGAFLKHPSNLTALLAAGCAAIFASMPLGWAGLGLVGAVALGTEALAALAIPSLPSFKAWVDREQHQQARSQRQTRLLAELNNYGDKKALATYQQMCSRVQALYQTAGDARTTLTHQDVDKLEDLTVDYLGLCVAHLSLRQRKDGTSEDVLAQRIAELQAQLQTSRLPEDEARQLRSALAQYTESLQRSRRLAVRRSALEATLVSMPDKMEEVYQLVITSPYSSEMGRKLEDSLARLRIAEEVAAEFDTPEPWELELPRTGKPALTAMGAVQQAARGLKA
ncbi:hypothetical protein [Rhodoferax sp.]|uniref:hypothetical protein n=1 Tax=Rhodoferax sp. TaxID=50421 RepID=UPI0025E4F096|nr:hypothetical protein [Rhodoferax sp.]